MEKKYILTEHVAEMKLRRMAFEIIENNREEKKLILAGILDNGMVLARQIKTFLELNSQISVQLIEISLDKQNPLHCEIHDASTVKNEVVIVMDDVINSGKTFLYALIPLLNEMPRKIQTLTLVERSYKTFPVHADYVGVSLSTTLQDHIYVEVLGDKVIGAFLY
jgi:pyrimidine operon attenuation protein/uracil phosphoribosyltransferase